MPGLHAQIPVPDIRVAQCQIPPNYKGISTSLTGIEGPGDEMPKRMLDDIPDEDDVQNKTDVKNIKKFDF